MERSGRELLVWLGRPASRCAAREAGRQQLVRVRRRRHRSAPDAARETASPIRIVPRDPAHSARRGRIIGRRCLARADRRARATPSRPWAKTTSKRRFSPALSSRAGYRPSSACLRLPHRTRRTSPRRSCTTTERATWRTRIPASVAHPRVQQSRCAKMHAHHARHGLSSVLESIDWQRPAIGVPRVALRIAAAGAEWWAAGGNAGRGTRVGSVGTGRGGGGTGHWHDRSLVP